MVYKSEHPERKFSLEKPSKHICMVHAVKMFIADTRMLAPIKCI